MLHDEPAVPGPPAVVGEAKEGEGFRTPLAALLSGHGREATELDEARLVLVEQQAELGQPIPELCQHLSCICFPVEPHDEVVGIAHDRDSTACMSATPLVDPKVED